MGTEGQSFKDAATLCASGSATVAVKFRSQCFDHGVIKVAKDLHELDCRSDTVAESQGQSLSNDYERSQSLLLPTRGITCEADVWWYSAGQRCSSEIRVMYVSVRSRARHAAMR